MDSIKKRSKCIINSYNYSPQLCSKSAIIVSSNDQMMKLNSKRSSCCRVIILQKSRTGSYGFTLQTYAFKNYKTDHTELLTYIDFVEVGGPAFRSGMKRGDVILSINDRSIEGLQHEQLVHFIKQSPCPLRLTVTNEDWCTRIDLNLRKLKLKQLLKEKYLELTLLEKKEKELLRRCHCWNLFTTIANGNENVRTEGGQWCQKEVSSECCSSDLSTSDLVTSDLLSPFSSRRASFMCTSLDVLHDFVVRDASSLKGESKERTFGKNPRSGREREGNGEPRQTPGRSYESRSLPIVRKKKHFLQNQVFAVCENVARTGCFSGSSVDDSSVEEATPSRSDSDGRTDGGLDRMAAREQSKTWYGVPRTHRAALLKRQRKTSEVSKWYFSFFDDDDDAGFRAPPAKSGCDPSTSESTDGRLHLLESLGNCSNVPANRSLEADFALGALMVDLPDAGAQTCRRRPRSGEEVQSSGRESNPGPFEDLSFESREFMNSLSSAGSPHEGDRRRTSPPPPADFGGKPDSNESEPSPRQSGRYDTRL